MKCCDSEYLRNASTLNLIKKNQPKNADELSHLYPNTPIDFVRAYCSLLQFNFVGKLLGPRGNSLKRLQEDTLTKMSILGKGSMRDKEKVKPGSVLYFSPCPPCSFHPLTSSSFCFLLLFWSFWVIFFESIITKQIWLS